MGVSIAFEENRSTGRPNSTRISEGRKRRSTLAIRLTVIRIGGREKRERVPIIHAIENEYHIEQKQPYKKTNKLTLDISIRTCMREV